MLLLDIGATMNEPDKLSLKVVKNMQYLLGLTTNQFELFQFIKFDLDSEDVSRKELHELLGIDSATIARHLTRLINIKLLTREYALSENAPPHYRYKTYTTEYYNEYVENALLDFKESIETWQIENIES